MFATGRLNSGTTRRQTATAQKPPVSRAQGKAKGSPGVHATPATLGAHGDVQTACQLEARGLYWRNRAVGARPWPCAGTHVGHWVVLSVGTFHWSTCGKLGQSSRGTRECNVRRCFALSSPGSPNLQTAAVLASGCHVQGFRCPTGRGPAAASHCLGTPRGPLSGAALAPLAFYVVPLLHK